MFCYQIFVLDMHSFKFVSPPGSHSKYAMLDPSTLPSAFEPICRPGSCQLWALACFLSNHQKVRSLLSATASTAISTGIDARCTRKETPCCVRNGQPVWRTGMHASCYGWKQPRNFNCCGGQGKLMRCIPFIVRWHLMWFYEGSSQCGMHAVYDIWTRDCRRPPRGPPLSLRRFIPHGEAVYRPLRMNDCCV